MIRKMMYSKAMLRVKTMFLSNNINYCMREKNIMDKILERRLGYQMKKGTRIRSFRCFIKRQWMDVCNSCFMQKLKINEVYTSS